MSTDNFYSTLPVLADFSAIADFSRYSELPHDWQVVVADVENSTGAIAAGHYKAVNIVGVSVITAVLNIARPVSLPSVFGGDGAALCIPPEIAAAAGSALLAVQALALEQYGLRLRVGIVPMATITAGGCRVLVARHRVSTHYVQTAFAGGGIEYAENLLKHESRGRAFRLEQGSQAGVADFSGLECRWDSVPSQHGEIISLIVKALAGSEPEQSRFYEAVISRIEAIYGDDDSSHPVYVQGLKLGIGNRQLRYESALKTYGLGAFDRFRHFLTLRMEVLLGMLFMKFNIRTGDTSWGRYKEEVARNTDCRKFDGLLRQVLSGTAEQREALTAYLENRHEKGECVYGIHSSGSALVTCLITRRSGNHYHFVDGADGGYAMAAAAMKKQLGRRGRSRV